MSEPLQSLQIVDPRDHLALRERVDKLEREVRLLRRREREVRLLSVHQVSERLPALSPQAIYDRIRRRESNGLADSGALVRDGRRWLIDLDKLTDWLERGRVTKVNRKDDPYFDNKNYHFAAQMREDGAVSALCYKRPRAINLSRGQSWTTRPEAVTCQSCRRILREQGHL